MRPHVHALVRWRIRRLFTAGLPPAAYRSVLEEVAGCPACAALFARYQALESALCGGAEVLTPFALERVGAAVLEEVAAPQAAARSVLRRAWAGAAVVAVAMTVLVVRGADREPVADSRLVPVALTARGPSSAASANVGIRVLRVADGALDESSALSPSDLLTFAYTNAGPRPRYLSLFGVQEDGRVRWYYPSEHIEPGKADEPLGDGFRLSASHAPGWLRITGLFCERPLSEAEVEGAVQELGRCDGAIPGMVPWPELEGVLEHSVRVEVGPGRAMEERE